MCTKLVFLKPISGICLKCKTKEKQQTQGGLKITGKPRSRVSLLQMKTAGESNSSDTLSPTSTCDSTWIFHQLYLPCMEGESQQLLQEVLFLAYGRRREAVVSCIYIVFKLKFEDEFMFISKVVAQGQLYLKVRIYLAAPGLSGYPLAFHSVMQLSCTSC